MKRITFLLAILVALFVSCETSNQQEKPRYDPNSSKIIKTKDAPSENRFSAGDYFFGGGSITKTQTVYYFYAKDGTSVEVDRKIYFQYDEGDSYYGYWR